MPRVPGARQGDVLNAKGRRLPFSYFPVTKGNRRYGLYDTVFAVSPWSVMRGEISNRLKADQESEALAFLQQAEDFHRAASSGVSTNPVLTRRRHRASGLDRRCQGLWQPDEHIPRVDGSARL